jgi:D-amino-acid dehydrogenase
MGHRERTGADAPVAVIGAGIIGTAIALTLCRRGRSVVLVDRDRPGAGASHGNGGILARCAIVPVNAPGLWRSAPGMLMAPDGPLFLRPGALLALLPWMAAFLSNATGPRCARTAEALAPLLLSSLDDHRALAANTAAAAFIHPTDYLYLYRDRAAFAADRTTWTLRARAGLTWQELDETALREREPALSDARRFAIAQPGHGIVTDPGQHVAALAGAVADAGGRVQTGVRVRALEPDNDGVTLVTDGAPLRASQAVIAAGAWSQTLARPLGVSVRLTAERGYHLDLTDAAPGPRHPLMDAERKMVVTPMQGRVRLAGLVEFAAADAPAARRPVDLLRRGGAELFPTMRHGEAVPWVGPRPATTDSLPVLGPVPASGRIFAAYGHQHIGLTAAATTARLVADAVCGSAPDIDLSPYRPDR